MPPKQQILFRRCRYLAVVGDTADSFWLCKASQHVYSGLDRFNVRWLEEADGDADGERSYRLAASSNSVGLADVVREVKLKRAKTAGSYVLPRCEELKVAADLRDLGRGKRPKWRPKGLASDGESEEEEEEEEEDLTAKKIAKKRKAEDGKSRDKSPARKQARDKAGKGRATKQADVKDKADKKTKVKIIKPPNWRLKSNDKITPWSKNPMFDSKESVPYISSTAQSKLIIRAVLTENIPLLKKCMADHKHVHSLSVNQSLGNRMTALQHAIREENLPAIRALAKELKKESKIKWAPAPTCLLKESGTGKYNYRSLGIRYIRKLNMSRGGREGNNALMKDLNSIVGDDQDRTLSTLMMKWNTPLNVVNEVVKAGLVTKVQLLDRVSVAILQGNCELPAHFLKAECDKSRNNYRIQYSHLHHEALTFKGEVWKDRLTEASVKRGGAGYGTVSPLQCACINPDPRPLKQLFAICPDVNMSDNRNRKLVHFAARAKSPEPLKFLVSYGANLEDVDRDGKTPLMIACSLGRTDTAEFIIKTLQASENKSSPIVMKMGTAGIERPSKESYCPVHFAVEGGHLDTVEMLVRYGVNLEKTLNVFHEKKTPLMLAAIKGNLDMVEYLVERVKVEKTDKFKKTALTHAVMNGEGHVASFLLHLGADPNRKDSSGNSNLHYACAYGWYFCMEILIKAGAEINATNEWKLTPVAVAFLKGHTGIGKHLLDLPGVDINFQNDEGQTVLLSMISEVDQTNPLSKELFEEIEHFIIRRDADAKIVDSKGKNALHYLCTYNVFPRIVSDMEVNAYKKKVQLQMELQKKLIHLFIENDCSTMATDEQGYCPLMYAMERSINNLGKKSMDVINILLSDMKHKSQVEQLEFKAKLPNILHIFSKNVSLEYVSDEADILGKIALVINRLKSSGLLSSLEALVEARLPDNKFTPLMVLCQSYREKANNLAISDDDWKYKSTFYDMKRSKDGKLIIDNIKWRYFGDLIEYFIKTFQPKLHYDIKKYHKVSGETKKSHCTISALVLASHTPNEPQNLNWSLFSMLLTRDKNVNLTNEEGKTALIQAISKNQTNAALRFINAGAKLDEVFTTADYITCDKEEKVFLKSNAIIEAIKQANRNIVKSLLEEGVDISMKFAQSNDRSGKAHSQNLAFVAVQSCLKNRSGKENLAILNDLLHAGMDVNLPDKSNERNVLHLSVNSTSGMADQSLDLESVLLRSNCCNVLAKDKRGRLPLHYAFLKIGSPFSTSKTDPIEICGMLIEAMKGKHIDEPDEFGATPLHYAALRGATVCCHHLLQKGADVNMIDKHNNSPLAYAVKGKHEGCTLVLLQNGANVNVDINPMEKEKPSPAELSEFVHNTNGMEKQSNHTIFQGVLQNNWLGLSYLILEKLETFSMSYAKAVEISFQMQKIMFSKTLIRKQIVSSKLKEPVTQGRNLISSFAFECNQHSFVGIQIDILDMLMSSGLSLGHKDETLSSALHYACMNSNLTLVKAILDNEVGRDMAGEKNAFGMTPLGALFWNFKPDNASVKECMEKLLSLGVNTDFCFACRPVSCFRNGFESPEHSKKGLYDPKDARLSPLIVAIIHRDTKVVERLLENGAGINFPDSNGMTPLLHAVKTNNMDMTKLLLSKIDVDLEARDDHGCNVFYHLVMLKVGNMETGSFDNDKILEMLLNAGADPGVQATDTGALPLDLASEVGAFKIATKLASVTRKARPAESAFTSPILHDPATAARKFDVAKDAHAMLKQLEIQATKKAKKLRKRAQKILPRQVDSSSEDSSSEEEEDGEEEESGYADSEESDSDSGSDYDDKEEEGEESEADENVEKHSGCQVKKGCLHRDYATLMTKVDVRAGHWGMYNFYRMQIWKEKHKDLWILFTNWGRIGDDGQYQNTPFGSAEQAEQEFEKIFKAKSGNEWSARKHFVNQPKRYRLVKLEHLKHVKKSELNIDLESSIPSTLPKSVQDLVKDIGNVSLYVNQYKAIGSDYEAVPFGRIKREVVLQAQGILNKLEGLIKKKDTLMKKRHQKKTAAKVEEDLQSCLQSISHYSSEYFYLMPKQGFKYNSLYPIDSSSSLEQEQTRVSHTLDFETAERLLLGAQYRKGEINPLDYIYQALDCRMQPLQPGDEEVPYILQHMFKSASESTLVVQGIFKVARPEEDRRFPSFVNKFKSRSSRSHLLLWHGSKTANLLSILHSGLLTNAPFAPRTGRAFGAGVYTADDFTKSWPYTSDYRPNSWQPRKRQQRNFKTEVGVKESRYMILSDVALGKCLHIKNYTDRNKHSSLPPRGYDSVKVHGKSEPDPAHSVHLPGGLEIPLGKMKKVPSRGPRVLMPFLDKNEFVTYSDDQTALRYIVKVGMRC